MKKCFFLLCLILTFSHPTRAFLLDEHSLSTLDGRCRIFYLTDKNTSGWYVGLPENVSCPEGVLNGYADVTVFNAFSQKAEQIYGYFSHGYWTGNAHLKKPLIKRVSEEYGVQKATLWLAKDDDSDIDYIIQMNARKDQNGTYGPFAVCDPAARVLAVTPHQALFKNPHATQEILDNVLTHVRGVCPTIQRILFFVSSLPDPKQTDIFFFADINLETGKTHIKRNTVLTPPQQQNLSPAESEKEPTRPVLTPATQNVSVSQNFPVENHPAPAQPLPDSIALKETPVLENQPAQKTPSSPETPHFEPEESRPETEESRPIDQIAHLKVVSDVLHRPVWGTAVVHVDSILFDGTALTDLPVPLKLYGKIPSIGWSLIAGYFSFPETNTSGSNLHGQVQLASFISCATHMCQDIQ